MPLNIIEDIRSVTDLKVRTREVLEHARRTRRPVVITVNGRPGVVVVDAAEYEARQQALNLAVLLAEGEADIREGRTRPARELAREMKRAHQVPRRRHPRRGA
jgi:prevent-host-death family protein